MQRPKIDLEALIAEKIAEAKKPGGKFDQEKLRVERHVENAQERLSAARRIAHSADEKVIQEFIDEVSPKLPGYVKNLSDGNGYRAVFCFYKNDAGPYSVQLWKDGKKRPERTLTNNSLVQSAKNKEWRDEKLRRELQAHPDGFACANETQMMKEILRLRNIITAQNVLANAEREARGEE